MGCGASSGIERVTRKPGASASTRKAEMPLRPPEGFVFANTVKKLAMPAFEISVLVPSRT